MTESRWTLTPEALDAYYTTDGTPYPVATPEQVRADIQMRALIFVMAQGAGTVEEIDEAWRYFLLETAIEGVEDDDE